MAGGPILIGGLDRSGKTQLRLALELIPDVAWTRRADLWTRLAGRLGDVRDRATAERAIARLARVSDLADPAPDPARLAAELPSALADAETRAIAESRLLGLVLAQRSEALGRSRWGLQEAGIERHAATILDAFPEASCIVLVRDPRDRLAALLSHRWRPGAAGPATAAWKASVRNAKRAAARHPGRVLIIRLEDLIARPAEVLRAACEHVGGVFDEAMLHPGGADPFEVLAGSVGIFHRGLTPRQIALVQALAPRAMIALGYEPIATELAGLDRIRYWFVEAPFGMGRLAASRARTAVTGRPA